MARATYTHNREYMHIMTNPNAADITLHAIGYTCTRHHSISHRIASHRMARQCVTSHRITSHRIASHGKAVCHLALRHNVPNTAWHHIT